MDDTKNLRPKEKFMVDYIKQFERERSKHIVVQGKNKKLKSLAMKFVGESAPVKYSYNFNWLGRPIIQYPQDIIAIQELIWEVKPDLIVETGIARGGSIIFSASMLAILEACGGIKRGDVVGVDIDIRPYNKKAILAHPLSRKITMFEGSSIDEKIIRKVIEFAKTKKRILVCLDSSHAHDHVLAELKAYAPLVSVGSYCIVGDTVIEDLPEGSTSDRPWGKGNNPKTAVREFLKNNKKFKIDKIIESKLIITGSPGGYLKRIK